MIPGDQHVIVVGLGFGDEGKGATVDYLCATRPVSAVVRFNGGGQAAHNVLVESGQRGSKSWVGLRHTFRLFGSGTLSGVPTVLSRNVLVDPVLLAAESEVLSDLGVERPLDMLAVDPDALVVTPVHVAVNRTREDLRGAGRHGSTGLGIGETVWYDMATRRGARQGETVENLPAPSDAGPAALRVRDCLDPKALTVLLDDMVRFYAPLLAGSRHGHPSVTAMAAMLSEFTGAVRITSPAHLAKKAEIAPLVFEGAQGVLLDEWRGFHPHTTWSTTTPANAQQLLAEAGLGRGYVLGASRAYTTRHGAGPFPTEFPALAGLLPETHNGVGEYQGAWRVGHLDLVALRYALEVIGGVDGVVLSHLDLIDAAAGAVQAAERYRVDGKVVDRLVPGAWTDLAHQQDLTRQAFAAVPLLRPLRDAQDAVRAVEALGAPVQVLGHGPGRQDRREV